MNAKTLSYNHKHICPKKPLEAIKDIEGIVVHKIKNRFLIKKTIKPKLNYML